MKYDEAKTVIVTRAVWGAKLDPTEYDYNTKTIRIRDDYLAQMSKINPLTNHWVTHELAHHILFSAFGMDYITKTIGSYPDNRIERFAYAYQFRYLKTHRACNTLQELYTFDSFFRHKKIYHASLEYYWNNASYIAGEIEQQIV
jgi:hypothetical protein